MISNPKNTVPTRENMMILTGSSAEQTEVIILAKEITKIGTDALVFCFKLYPIKTPHPPRATIATNQSSISPIHATEKHITLAPSIRTKTFFSKAIFLFMFTSYNAQINPIPIEKNITELSLSFPISVETIIIPRKSSIILSFPVAFHFHPNYKLRVLRLYLSTTESIHVAALITRMTQLHKLDPM